MTEFKASPVRMAGHAATAAFCLSVAAFGDDLGPVSRAAAVVFGVGIVGVVVVIAATRVVVDDDEIAIRRGFGKWFRAAPAAVTVNFRPIVNGLGRGHGWELKVGRKNRPNEGVSVPLSAWPPRQVAALRERLTEVTGLSTNAG